MASGFAVAVGGLVVPVGWFAGELDEGALLYAVSDFGDESGVVNEGAVGGWRWRGNIGTKRHGDDGEFGDLAAGRRGPDFWGEGDAAYEYGDGIHGM